MDTNLIETHHFIKTFKALAHTVHASLQVMWTTVCSTLMKTVRSYVHCTSISWRIILSKWCATLNGSFHSLLLGSFLLTTVVECLQGYSMRSLNCLQWVAPTHQPQNHQNRAHTVQANPLFLTLWSIGVLMYCFPWGFINLWFFVFNICVWFLCSTFVCGSLQFSMTLVCGFLDPSCNTIVSLPTSVVFGYM